MDSKQPNRRGPLKDGAALVGLAVGTVRSARGQTPVSEAHTKDIKELFTYGERSRFVTSIRMPVAERPSPGGNASRIVDTTYPGRQIRFGMKLTF